LKSQKFDFEYNLYIHLQQIIGGAKKLAEIIPIEPDTDNAGEGKMIISLSLSIS
jgi:hypothetical protein